MTMHGNCVNASMLYIVRERPQMIAMGVKKPLDPSKITNPGFDFYFFFFGGGGGSLN